MTSLSLLFVKWWKPIMLSAFLAMLITGIVVGKLPRYWDVSVDFTIPIPDRPATTNYEYDGFYALQATDLFSNTLAGWFRSPDFVTRIFARANVPLRVESARKLEKIFKVKKISGQLITVSFSANDEREASAIGAGIVTIVKEQIVVFNDKGKNTLVFSAIPGKALVIPVRRAVAVSALIAGLIVIVFGFNVVILTDAFSSRK